MHDSTVGSDSVDGVETGVQVKLVAEAAGRVTVSVGVDSAWLNDPARVFPVVIDPSFVSNAKSSGGADTYVVSNATVGSEWSNSLLSVGLNNGYYNRSLISFSLPGSRGRRLRAERDPLGR